ncbi:MAG: MoaD/ThiS family protein [Nitrososphaerota archaeon]
MLVQFHGWLIQYFGKEKIEIEINRMKLREFLEFIDKDKKELLKSINKQVFIAVNHEVVYDLEKELNNNDFISIFPIGSGG